MQFPPPPPIEEAILDTTSARSIHRVGRHRFQLLRIGTSLIEHFLHKPSQALIAGKSCAVFPAPEEQIPAFVRTNMGEAPLLHKFSRLSLTDWLCDSRLVLKLKISLCQVMGGDLSAGRWVFRFCGSH